MKLTVSQPHDISPSFYSAGGSREKEGRKGETELDACGSKRKLKRVFVKPVDNV